MKYFEGDRLGPNPYFVYPTATWLKRYFSMSCMRAKLETKISHIVDGRSKSCGCNPYALKYKNGDKIGKIKYC